MPLFSSLGDSSRDGHDGCIVMMLVKHVELQRTNNPTPNHVPAPLYHSSLDCSSAASLIIPILDTTHGLETKH